MFNRIEEYRHRAACRAYLSCPADRIWAHWAYALQDILYRARKKEIMKQMNTNPFAGLKTPSNKTEGRTYDEWQADGYQVCRGERATGRNADGVATFTEEQVKWADVGDDDYDADLFFNIDNHY